MLCVAIAIVRRSRQGYANLPALMVVMGNDHRQQQNKTRRQHYPTQTSFAYSLHAAKIYLL